MQYQARSFNLPSLKGLSQKQLEVHLALYEGYVKHTNLIMEKIAALRAEDPTGNAYVMAELRRRLGFEFDGMRMHEYYFEQLEEGAISAQESSPLAVLASERYGSWNGFVDHIREVAGTRGIGWTVVYYDPRGNTLHTAWVNDHELGQLSGLPVILALDMWEHAFMVDYVPAEKKSYVEAFLENLNWRVIEERYAAALH
jgi:superoxide dismutase, Fe-Mn family